MTQIADAARANNAPANSTSIDAAAVLAENVRLKADAEKLTQRISGLDKQNQDALRKAKEADEILASLRERANPSAPKIDTSKPDYFDEDGNFDPVKHAAWLDAKMDERETRKASESRLLAQQAAVKTGAASIPAELLPKDDPDAAATVEAMIEGLTQTIDPSGTNPEAAKQATAKVKKMLEYASTVGAVTVEGVNKKNAADDHPAGAGGGAGGATSTTPITLQQVRDATPEGRKKMMVDGVAGALKAMFGGPNK